MVDSYVILGAVLIMFFFFIMILLISFDVFSKRRLIVKTRDMGNYYSSGSCFDYKNETDLEESQQEAPEMMFYRASHDLKSPLKSIQGLVQLGLKDQDPEHRRVYLEKINETAVGLEEFISEILDLGKIKRKRIQSTQIDVHKLVADCIHSFKLYPDRKKVRVRFEYEPNLMVMSDENLLRTVIHHMIENAIKYRDNSKKQPQITISAYQHKGTVNLNFSDNGIGIRSENIPYIFDLFYRVDSKSEGAGLGLYIVKETVKRMKACIKAYSEYGKGSMFILEIPVKTPSNNESEMINVGQRLN